jgi:uncharacterized protein YprB with RNaseH-like and TPR domain
VRLENSFIGADGVAEGRERSLWEAGVLHWDDFDDTVLGPKTTENVESFIYDARAHLDDGDSRFFAGRFPSNERWRLYENFRDETCFFDIETTGLSHHRDDVTTVSFHRDGETTTLVRGEDLTADRLREQFVDASLLVTFNGASFDIPFLETSFDLTIDTPHVDLMPTCRRIGLSGGLKRVERDIGIERDRPDISGRDAVRLWHEYERGDQQALDTLVSYNREDTVNLRTLMDEVCGALHQDVFGAYQTTSDRR